MSVLLMFGILFRQLDKTMEIRSYFLSFLLYLCLFDRGEGLHLHGQWQSDKFFKFLGRFGFQQTNTHEKSETQGYIYGNLTSKDDVKHKITFVVVDSEYFLYFFGNRSESKRNDACSAMFKKIDLIAWDRTCNSGGQEDFLRRIPCARDGLCDEEDDPKWVIPGFQFTYRVQDTRQPRFAVLFVCCVVW